MTSWALVPRWLANCLRTHTRCSPQRSKPWYPRRVVDVGHEPGRFRVIESVDVTPGDEYLTLSHRWGIGKNILKLHANRLKEFERGMDLAVLSRTFQDAAVVAQRLGVRYLWIDSLCIIQEGDNLRDWTEQAPVMKDVYMNALCNISADWAVSEDDGLFFKRDLSWFEPFRVAFGGRTWGPSYLDQLASEVNDAPLNHRGWVAQERILANRCIHFCRREIFWECRERILSESFPESTASLPGNSPALSILQLKNFYGDHDVNSGGGDDAARGWARQRVETEVWGGAAHGLVSWNQAVSYYSKCQLTYVSDKLVAISGIARKLRPWIGCTYLAGLWERTLLTDIAWQRRVHVDRDRERDEKAVAGTREPAGPYHAPSFSWVSSPFRTTLARFHWRRIAVYADVSCVQAETDDPVTDDVFGPLRSPALRLKLTGPLRRTRLEFAVPSLCQVHVRPLRRENDLESTAGHSSLATLDFNVAPSRQPDFEEGIFYYVPLVLVEIKDDVPQLQFYAIVLEILDQGRSEYKRIGIISTMKDEEREALLAHPEYPGPSPGPLDKESGNHTVYVV